MSDEESGGGGGVPKVVIWIGLLILVNVLSQVFDWGYIIY